VTDAINTSPEHGAAVVVAVFVAGAAELWASTLASLPAGCPGLPIVAGGPDVTLLEKLEALAQRHGLALETGQASDVGDLIGIVARGFRAHALFISVPVVLPPRCLDAALKLADEDLRCASVSFFSNAAGYVSFPVRDTPTWHAAQGADEATITRRLRRRPFVLAPVPIPYATGPAVLLTKQGLSLAGPPRRSRWEQPGQLLLEYSSRAREHGMVDYLDASTFITSPPDLVVEDGSGESLSAATTARLHRTDRALALAPTEPSEHDAAFGRTFDAARAAVLGLRVIIDGTCLQATEMGHQVSLLALIGALADHSGIAYLGVAVPGPLPTYAAEKLAAAKVDVRVAPHGDFTVFPRADIVHRPFQPSHDMRPRTWSQVGHRTLVTIHDLISYQVPGYHESPQAWFTYRKIVRDACSEVDALIVISNDVRRAVAAERLPVDDERVYVVPNGTTHLRGDEPEVMPGELLARGFTGEEFLLVLGTDYSHKNRDLAIRTLDELTLRGRSLALVMAGAHVPFGSSRSAEAIDWRPALSIYPIPDVNSAERNWLLRHASIVLYPTSAEGFGLIPEEAAACGTPALFVPFGPLSERHRQLPVTPSEWSAEAFADAAERLLDDPLLRARQVAEICAGGDGYDWAAAAESTVEAYWSALGRPARPVKAEAKCKEEDE